MLRNICGNYWVDSELSATQYREKDPKKRFIKWEEKRENSVPPAFAAQPHDRYMSGTKLRRVIKFHICFSHILLTPYMKFHARRSIFWFLSVSGLIFHNSGPYAKCFTVKLKLLANRFLHLQLYTLHHLIEEGSKANIWMQIPTQFLLWGSIKLQKVQKVHKNYIPVKS